MPVIPSVTPIPGLIPQQYYLPSVAPPLKAPSPVLVGVSSSQQQQQPYSQGATGPQQQYLDLSNNYPTTNHFYNARPSQMAPGGNNNVAPPSPIRAPANAQPNPPASPLHLGRGVSNGSNGTGTSVLGSNNGSSSSLLSVPHGGGGGGGGGAGAGHDAIPIPNANRRFRSTIDLEEEDRKKLEHFMPLPFNRHFCDSNDEVMGQMQMPLVRSSSPLVIGGGGGGIGAVLRQDSSSSNSAFGGVPVPPPSPGRPGSGRSMGGVVCGNCKGVFNVCFYSGVHRSGEDSPLTPGARRLPSESMNNGQPQFCGIDCETNFLMEHPRQAYEMQKHQHQQQQQQHQQQHQHQHQQRDVQLMPAPRPPMPRQQQAQQQQAQQQQQQQQQLSDYADHGPRVPLTTQEVKLMHEAEELAYQARLGAHAM